MCTGVLPAFMSALMYCPGRREEGAGSPRIGVSYHMGLKEDPLSISVLGLISHHPINAYGTLHATMSYTLVFLHFIENLYLP